MKSFTALARHRALLRARLPAALFIALLQRTPVVRTLAAVEECVAASPLGAVLRSAAAAAAGLGTMHSLAGATVLAASQSGPVTVPAGAPISPIGFTVTDTINIGSWQVGGTLPPGLSLAATQNPGISVSGPGLLDATTSGADDGYGGQIGGNATTTPLLMGTPSQAGIFTFSLQAFEFANMGGRASNAFNFSINVTGAPAPSAPSFVTQPSSQAATAGGSITLAAAANGSPTFQWLRNGANIDGATSSTLNLNNVQPATTGLYVAAVTNAGGSVTSTPAIVGLSSTSKVIGTGTEIASDIVHANGNIFDQVLLEGAASSMRADSQTTPPQILRTSCIDSFGDDIIQVEFAGPGTLSVVIDGVTGPALPANYNQGVFYMKGHIGIVVVGATENTHLSVFSVGRGNAVNQALFKSEVDYDGLADIAFVAISSSDGKFGGLRTANALYSATRGFTGVYAPGVEFTGPVFVGDINASASASPVFIIGSSPDVRLTGGDLEQANGRAVQVGGITQLKMVNGSTSHFVSTDATPTELLPGKTNRGRLEQNGVDVTSQIVVNPGG